MAYKEWRYNAEIITEDLKKKIKIKLCGLYCKTWR